MVPGGRVRTLQMAERCARVAHSMSCARVDATSQARLENLCRKFEVASESLEGMVGQANVRYASSALQPRKAQYVLELSQRGGFPCPQRPEHTGVPIHGTRCCFDQWPLAATWRTVTGRDCPVRPFVGRNNYTVARPSGQSRIFGPKPSLR
eukprot:4064860-Alexandrium_andersonii.AAC.1